MHHFRPLSFRPSAVRALLCAVIVAFCTAPADSSPFVSPAASSPFLKGAASFSSIFADVELGGTGRENQAGKAIASISAPSALPYLTEFEAAEGYTVGHLDGQLGWVVAQGDAMVVTVDPALGKPALSLLPGANAAAVTQSFVDTNIDGVIYCDFYAVPASGLTPEQGTVFQVGQEQIAFLQANGIAYLEVSNNDGQWSALPTSFQVNANGRLNGGIRLTTRMDFKARSWVLFANGNQVSSALPLSPKENDHFSRFSVKGSETVASTVSSIYIGSTDPLVDGNATASAGSGSASASAQSRALGGGKAGGSTAKIANAIVTKPKTLTPQLSTTGMVLWLKADTGVTTSAGAITQWADQSGAGNNATQTVTANSPTLVASAVNGLPAAQFTASSSQWLNLPALLNGVTQGEVFVVLKATSAAPTAGRGLWNFGPQNNSYYPYTDSTIYDSFGSNTWYNVGLPATGVAQYSLYDVSAQAGQWTAQLDGLVFFHSASNTVGFNTNALNLGRNGNGNPFDGTIAEIIVYNQVQTAAQRLVIGQYLQSRYALPGISVPANPTALKATALSATEVSLAWTDAATSTGITYTVWRMTGSGSYAAVAQVNNALSFIDSGLTAGTAYTYEISSTTLAGSSPAYSPTAAVTTLASGTDMPLTGMRLWLKGDSGVQKNSGGSVIQWVDQGGSGNNALQLVTSSGPTVTASAQNSLPAIQFTASSSQWLNLPNLLNGVSQGEVFVVLKATSATPTAARGLWNFGPQNSDCYPNADGTIHESFATNSSNTIGIPASGTAQYSLYEVSGQSGSWQAQIDGLLLLNLTSSSVGFNTNTLTLGKNGNGNPFDGGIAEILVYNQVLTAAQRLTVSQYLQSRYALPSIAVPANPTALTAKALSATEVSLRWTDTAKTTGITYTVWRQTGSGSYAAVAQLANARSYVDRGLTASTTYSYEISSSTFAGPSPGFSTAASATTLATGTDMPLTGLLLWLKADSGMEATSGGSVIQWLDQGGGGNNANQLTTANQPTLSATALNSQPAVLFAAASNQWLNLGNVLNGATQAEAFVVLKATSAAPTAARGLWNFGPQNSDYYPNTDGTVHESFGTNNSNNLGIPASGTTQYSLYDVSGQSGSWQAQIDGLGLVNSATNTVGFNTNPLNLGRNGNGNAFDGGIAEVLVYNQVLTAAQRLTVGQYLQARYALPSIAVPANPGGLVAKAISPTEVSLRWTDTAKTTGITYTIWRKLGSGSFAAVAQVNNALSYIDTGLTAGGAYSYEISSSTLAGASPGYSATVAATTPATGTDMPFTGMKLWLKGDSGVEATSGGSIIQWLDQSGNGNNATQEVSANQPTLTASAINGQAAVQFTAASSQWLNLPGLLNGMTQGEVFVILKATSATPTAARGLWNFGPQNSDYYPNTDSTIRESFGSNSQYNLGTPGSGTAQYSLYNISAQAGQWTGQFEGAVFFNSATNTVGFNTGNPLNLGRNGNSNYFDGAIAEVIVYSQPLTSAQRLTVGQYLQARYALPGIAVPANPSALTVTAIGQDRANLSWSESTTTGVTFTIWRKTGSGSYAAVGQTSALTYTDTGLTAGTAYTYEISAGTIAGNSSGYSSAVAATTMTRGTASTVPLTNMRIWLSADYGIATSGPTTISQWADQSGNSNNALQASANNQPTFTASAINGRPVVQFTAANNQYLGLPSSLMSGATQGEVFVVVKATTAVPGSARGLWSLGGSSNAYYPNSDGNIYETFGSTSTYEVGAPPSGDTNFSVYDVTSQAGQFTASVDGLTLFKSSTNTVSFSSQPYLGTDGSNLFDGQVAEIIIYSSVLTAANRSTVESYLQNKYNLPGIAVPANPTSLAATTLSATEMSLVWSDVATTTGITYTVWRKTGSGSYAAIATVNNGLSYVDSGLTAGTTYSYEISSSTIAGNSPGYSNTVSVATLASGTDMPLTGMVLWLKADSGVLAASNGSAMEWWDQSGNANNGVQFNVTNQPVFTPNTLNGRPVLNFAQSNTQFFNLQAALLTSATQAEVFVVLKAASSMPTGPRGLWAYGGSTNAYYPNTDGNIYETLGSSTQYFVGNPASNVANFNLYNIRAQPAQWSAQVDGTVMVNRTTNTVSFGSSSYLGTNGYNPFDGQIAEVIIYNGVLTAAQRATVGHYLEVKYSLPGITVPANPTSLVATNISPGETSLTWNDSATTTGITYTVWRKTGSGSFASVGQVTDALSFVDSGLSASTAYTYEISSSTLAGSSPGFSNTTAITTLSSGSDMPLTGMLLWLRGDSGVQFSSGSSISQWADQSGNANNAYQNATNGQPTLTANALNGRPVVQFTAAGNQSLFLPATLFNGATQGEIFVVVNAATTTPTSPRALWSLSGSGNSYYPYTDGKIYETFGSNAQYPVGAPPSNVTNYSIYDVSAQSGQWAAQFNGSALFSSASNTVSFSTYPQLGTNGGNYFDGQVAELILYNAVLTSQQRSAVQLYLTNKYAIATAPGSGNTDGVPNSWLLYYFGTTAMNPAISYDGTALTAAQDYAAGINPVDLFNGRAFQVQPSGLGNTYSYDLSGRLVEASYSGGANVQFTNDASSNLTSVANFGPIVTWRSANGLPPDGTGNGGDAVVLASDGVPNLVKYALALAPSTAAPTNTPLVTVSNINGGYLTLTYTRPNPAPTDLIYTVQVSSDNGTWSSGSSATTLVSTTVNGGVATVVVRDNVALSAGGNINRRIQLVIQRIPQP